MKKFAKITLALLLTLAAVGTGIGLPLAVSEYGDRRLEQSESALYDLGVTLELNSRGSISLAEKFDMLINGDPYAVETDAAKYMDSEAAMAKAFEWLGDFAAQGISVVDTENAGIEEAAPGLLTDNYGERTSFFIWSFRISDGKGEAVVILDDETGSLLALRYEAADTDIELSVDAAPGINLHVPMEFYCKKLGCELVEIDEEEASASHYLYNIVISFDGGKSYIRLPLEGSVRSFAFVLPN